MKEGARTTIPRSMSWLLNYSSAKVNLRPTLTVTCPAFVKSSWDKGASTSGMRTVSTRLVLSTRALSALRELNLVKHGRMKMNMPAIALVTVLLVIGSQPIAAVAQQSEQPQQAEAKDERPYSVDTTTIGTLLDDPEAAAILERLIPTVYNSDIFRTMGRPNTLRVAQQYESAVLTEEKMQEIQAEFDRLSAEE